MEQQQQSPPTNMTTTTTTTSLDRKKRKEEGRQKKKRRIEEAGGVRPRTTLKESSPSTSNNNKTVDNDNNPGSSPNSNHQHKRQESPSNRPWNNTRGGGGGPKNRHNNNASSSSSSSSRFGKVMDQVPTFQRPRTSTWSIAVPGSIVANAQTRELKTALVGQIARYATIYHVDEIVVYDDQLTTSRHPKHYHKNHRNNNGSSSSSHRPRRDDNKDDKETETTEDSSSNPSPPQQPPHYDYNPHDFMARVLQYCETPQYLRRHFFPMHPSLQFAGLLAPTDAPHHVRAGDASKYREGVVLERRPPSSSSGGSLVNCGIYQRPVEIAERLQPGIRCTIRIDPAQYTQPKNQPIRGQVVSPSAPREDDGTYWGYTTRMASSLKAVLDECPFPDQGGYDLKVGTSERGTADIDHGTFVGMMPRTFRHAILVFGGVAGIEESVDADESLRLPGAQSKKLFDLWINVCKYQGSRTIRTEEAVLITLAKLSPHFLLDGSKQQQQEGKKSKTKKNEAEVAPLVFDDDDNVSEESSEDDE
mmetsp:Transcript_16961/g.37039  ORF Transcript_16961/g.37039 Transcript_16961/m.37039 type:complete len:531 (-) Transcript_16961:132-1724(-)|eukprot:CAMPEP_0168813776 /NCGR_PEP_ID=MMETSP0726-20121227/5340_1 /TAXON_ID=265536 /ORGANISM="Amphiprora sp., Strain CCMP467" /LENGTH=530 /DNA_ID=CAMNT_0008865931 /DNA_START=47 /DNA_END=1639 /DNA_ORIENTATION=+